MTLLKLEILILWLSFVNTITRFVCLHKQSTLLREYPAKGSFKTFNYQSIPSSTMHTRAARNVVEFCLIWISNLLSRVGFMSKLSRPYLEDQPRWCTIALSKRSGVYSVACILATKVLTCTGLNLLTPCQNSKFHARWDCTHRLHHFVNLSWFLSRLSQRAVYQICVPCYASSVRY